jgi:hypothetical protein
MSKKTQSYIEVRKKIEKPIKSKKSKKNNRKNKIEKTIIEKTEP